MNWYHCTKGKSWRAAHIQFNVINELNVLFVDYKISKQEERGRDVQFPTVDTNCWDGGVRV